MGTRIDENTPLADVLRLVDSWRFYRRLYGDDTEIVRNFALVIRSRVK